MNNNKIISKIFVIIFIAIIITIILLSFLGQKERLGYLSEFKLNENLSSQGNYSYNFRINYYSKIFRNSDIYGVYIDANKIIQDNNFIKEIKFNEKGSPYGELTSIKELNLDDKIDNIYYKLKIKFNIYIYLISFILIYFIYNILNSNFNINIVTRIFFALILILITYYIIFMKLNYNNFADSDTSSELILSNLLAKEHSILSSNWYYSTELRVLNTQLIFAPLFYLFDSWNNIRVVGATLLLIIMLISGIFLCKQLKLDKLYIASFAIIILTPFSREYFTFVMSKSYYIPHISISFITFGLILLTARLKNDFKYKKYFIILNCILCIISVLAGMGGLRQLLILYIPLFISSGYLFCIEKGLFFKSNKVVYIDTTNSHYFYIIFVETILILFSSIIGYLINSIYLSKIYYFSLYNHIKLTSFSLERLINVINGYLASIGFQEGTKIFSVSLLPNFICFITICILIISIIDILRNKIYSNEEKLLTLFFVVANIIFCGLYSFSDFQYYNRYNLPIVIFAYIIIIIFIKHKISTLKTKNYYNFFAIGIFVLFLLSGLLIYFTPYYITKNEFVDISNILKDYECRYGYASYWNGNVLTELSDGTLEIYSWNPDINTISNVNEIFTWLQLVKHSTEVPSGKIFCIFSANELGSPIAKSMEGSDILYKTDKYTIYIFQSYDSIILKVNTYFENN
ncbi:hypothetical protein [uncultured Brachyspira sp.]|uniref:hypothetical protein n=1 Tax=uncultured Brachyspira sp. TaxID=221953 RepID=UPI0025E6A8BB|nr:hypothetical protein [uncultured Brachyspira sp.]